MNETEKEDALDRRLREAAPYIDDNGFTAGVLARLPAPHQQRSLLRAILLPAITLLGCVLAYILSDGGRFVSVNLERVATLPVVWLVAITLGSGVLVMAGGILAAFHTERQPGLR